MVTKGILFGPKVSQLFSFLAAESFYLSLVLKVFGFGKDYPPRMAIVCYIIRGFLGDVNGSENDNLWVPIPWPESHTAIFINLFPKWYANYTNLVKESVTQKPCDQQELVVKTLLLSLTFGSGIFSVGASWLQEKRVKSAGLLWGAHSRGTSSSSSSSSLWATWTPPKTPSDIATSRNLEDRNLHLLSNLGKN